MRQDQTISEAGARFLLTAAITLVVLLIALLLLARPVSAETDPATLKVGSHLPAQEFQARFGRQELSVSELAYQRAHQVVYDGRSEGAALKLRALSPVRCCSAAPVQRLTQDDIRQLRRVGAVHATAPPTARAVSPFVYFLRVLFFLVLLLPVAWLCRQKVQNDRKKRYQIRTARAAARAARYSGGAPVGSCTVARAADAAESTRPFFPR